MSLFDRLPHRTPRPVPKHGPRRIERFPLPPGLPGPDTHLYVEMDEPETAGPDDTVYFPAVEEEPTPAVRPLPVPEFTRLPLEFPPAADPTDTGVLQRTLDALRALPARPGAYLRNIIPGTGTGPSEALNGFPSFAGTSRMADGTPCAGLYLSDGDELGRHVTDITDVAWLGRLIDAAEEARERLYALQVPGLGEAAEGSDAA